MAWSTDGAYIVGFKKKYELCIRETETRAEVDSALAWLLERILGSTDPQA